jgi:hypothetical protein
VAGGDGIIESTRARNRIYTQEPDGAYGEWWEETVTMQFNADFGEDAKIVGEWRIHAGMREGRNHIASRWKKG